MGEVDAGRARSSALATKDRDLRGTCLYGEATSIWEVNLHPFCCALLASTPSTLKFNAIYVEGPKCFMSERVVWVVVSRCLNQASMKEDVKIIEDTII